MKQGVSVLICTYNGSQKLPDTLEHLASQKFEKVFPCEIVLVDNASTDNTATIAEGIWKAAGEKFPMRMVHESQQGKDYALYAGLQHVQYSYVVVCDDDNWLADSYIQHVFDVMSKNPDIGILGGRGLPVFEERPPGWIYQFEAFYAVGKQRVQSGEVKGDGKHVGFLWGAGCVINMNAYLLLKKAGYRRIITTDRYPDFRCEDIELCMAIGLTGFKIWYDDRLTYHHFISGDRLQWPYVMALSRSGGMGAALLRPYHEIGVDVKPAGNPWIHHFFYSLKVIFNDIVRTKNISNLFYLFFSLDRYKEGNYDYHVFKVDYFRVCGMLRIRREYNKVYKTVEALKLNINKLKTR